MAIMSALVFYVLPGLLGRSYDMKTETVGPDLFRTEDTEHAKVIERYITTSEYRVVSELSEATDFLDVSGKLALKLKTGAINVEGTGNYLKESKSFQNKVDLLVKVHYETVVLTLPSSIKPIADWEEVLKGSGMTHYIRSIKYGGDLVASVRFTTKNEADKEIIKAEVQGELNSSSGSFGVGLKGNLEKIQSKIGDTASMDINYYATVPLADIPRTIDGLTQLVDKFAEQTVKVNGRRGVPLSMEVFSLEALQKDAKTYYQTLALGDQMVILDEQFSDIRQAKQRLADWLKTVPPVLPSEEIGKVGLFATKLDELDKVFSETIANLNLSADASPSQFKPAFVAYLGNREEAIPNMYVKDLSKLKKTVLDKTPSFESDFGGAHFNYWGSDSCPAKTKLVFAGVMSTTDRNSIGSSQFTCLPDNRQYIDFPKDGSDEDEDIEDFPQINPVAFVSRKVGSPQKQLMVKCATCRVPGKSTTTTLVGVTDCPQNWEEQYQGILISTDYMHVRGKLVCIDTSRSFKDVPSGLSDLTIVTEVSPKCGDFPCSGGLNEKTAVPCVVCSITKKSSSKSDFLRL